MPTPSKFFYNLKQKNRFRKMVTSLLGAHSSQLHKLHQRNRSIYLLEGFEENDKDLVIKIKWEGWHRKIITISSVSEISSWYKIHLQDFIQANIQEPYLKRKVYVKPVKSSILTVICISWSILINRTINYLTGYLNIGVPVFKIRMLSVRTSSTHLK